MKKTTVEITEATTFKAAAAWVAEDLYSQGAERFDWDEQITYRLPSDAKVSVTTLTRSALAVMPIGIDANGVIVMKHELAQDRATAAGRIRLALMRANGRRGSTPKTLAA